MTIILRGKTHRIIVIYLVPEKLHFKCIFVQFSFYHGLQKKRIQQPPNLLIATPMLGPTKLEINVTIRF